MHYRVPLVDGVYRLQALPQPLAEDATMSLTVRAAPGVRLQRADGSALGGAAVVEEGAFTVSRVLTISPVPDTWRDRIQRFWDEPVSLGSSTPGPAPGLRGSPAPRSNGALSWSAGVSEMRDESW